VLPDDVVYGRQGTLDFADFEIDRTTGTLTMRGVIDNPEKFLRDGMFVRVRLRQPERTALALPASAVLVDMAGAYVYLVGEGGLVARQGVETGVSLDGLVEVVAGIAADDTVIVDGILRSRPGATVDAELVTLPEAMERLDPAAKIAGGGA
jgi:RND family efflux transporter MFP subunit